MADKASTAGTSSSHVAGDSPDSTVEINIKTLDSKIFTFRVDKDILVSALKEKLVDVTGVPVERQRLIFRGKVLKDSHLLSEYHLEDGHTLHLVARQPVVDGQVPGTGSEGTVQDNVRQGNASTTGVPRNRVGQVSHSVLLGTVNLAGQGESMGADIGQLVGAVLSSLGAGTGAPIVLANGQPSTATNNQDAPSAEDGGSQNATNSHVLGNSSPPALTMLHPFLNQSPQFPSTGFLSPNMVIPDSLTTLSEFMNHMELAFQNSGPHSSSDSAQQPSGPSRTETVSSSTRGLPTPEVLRTVIVQAEQLLRVNATAALSGLAARLERDGTSTDTVVRSEIQTEAMHVGRAMQHLGAMFLELGRTMMTLRTGQSPADSLVNAGPAVYISPLGPNPIMVQPFPLQANSMFGVSPPLVTGISGLTPTGEPSRNVNIHIHAGSPTPGALDPQQASRDGNSAGDSAPTRGLSSRTVVAAIPARPITQTSGNVLSVIYPVHVRSQLSVPIHSASVQVSTPSVSGGPQPSSVPVHQSSSVSGTLPPLVAQISAQVVNALSGGTQGSGLFSQNMQSTDAQRSQAQSSVSSQGDQTHSVPIHSASVPVSTPSVSGGPQPSSIPVHQSSSVTGTLPALVAQISAQVVNALSGGTQGSGLFSQNMQSADAQRSQAQSSVSSQGDQTPSEAHGLSVNAEGHSLSPNVQSTDPSRVGGCQQVPSDSSQDDGSGSAGKPDDAERESTISTITNVPGTSVPTIEAQKSSQEGSNGTDNVSTTGGSVIDVNSSAATSTGLSTIHQNNDDTSNERACESKLDTVVSNRTSESGSSSDRPAPLGLGLGGLQPKRRGKTVKPVIKDKVSQGTSAGNPDQESIARGQEFLHSLVSQSSDGPSNPQNSLVGQIMDGLHVGRPGANASGQVNASDMMTQILRTPGFSNLLTGVAEHNGIGSSDDLRSMLQQCTQSPAVRNTLNDIVQQVEGQPRSGGLSSGTWRGQGGLDFSRMIEQMMPAVSQALGRSSTRTTPTPTNRPTQSDGGDGRSRRGDMQQEMSSLAELDHAVEMIERHDSPGNVFRAVLESAGDLAGEGLGNSFGDLVNNEELTNEFMSMLAREIRRRLQTDYKPVE